MEGKKEMEETEEGGERRSKEREDQGWPGGMIWRSSGNACRTRDHDSWHILLRLPFTHCPLPAQKAHFIPNE